MTRSAGPFVPGDSADSHCAPVRVEFSQAQMAILQHALGLNEFGEGTRYRNHFVTGPGSKDFDDCRSLVAQGLMNERPGNALSGGSNTSVFCATPEGDAFVVANIAKRKPLTRGQQRYRSWLKADCGLTFGQWLTSPRLS